MNKTFDCVAMKNEIQARLLREEEGLSGAARIAAMRRALDRSRSPVGDLWRKLQERAQLRISRVAEEPGNYYGKDAGSGG